MLRAIVGVEIDVVDMQAKYKLSQNRKPDEVETLCKRLEAKGEHALAAAMRQALETRAQ
jgi:transcriptional regulator